MMAVASKSRKKSAKTATNKKAAKKSSSASPKGTSLTEWRKNSNTPDLFEAAVKQHGTAWGIKVLLNEVHCTLLDVFDWTDEEPEAKKHINLNTLQMLILQLNLLAGRKLSL